MKKTIYSVKTSLFRKFKYWAIQKLSGDMPVALNLVISRPKNYQGPLMLFNGKKEGLITKCFLFSTEGQALVEAVQDVDTESRLKDSK
jgi:hypothetical protein